VSRAARRRARTLALFAVFWFGAGAAANAPEPDSGASLPALGTYALPPIARVQDFTLLDSTGESAQLLALAPGQVAVVALIYTSCPSACPAALAILQQFDRELAREPSLRAGVRVTTVSFDPEYDTPAKMEELKERMSPQSDWRFLTAESEAAIQPVLESFGQDALRLVVPDEQSGPTASLMRHVLKVFLVDSAGDVRNIYSTGLMSKEMLLLDVRTLLLEGEAGSSRVAAGSVD
jgi:cytochrome oxidase Cu insertion factor (SCO1/SenC/PrrC family)